MYLISDKLLQADGNELIKNAVPTSNVILPAKFVSTSDILFFSFLIIFIFWQKPTLFQAEECTWVSHFKNEWN